MADFPKYSSVSFLNKLPVRVSTQLHRQGDDIIHFHRSVQLVHVLSGTLYHTVNERLYLQTTDTGSPLLPFMRHTTDLMHSDDTPVVIFCSFYDSFLTDRGVDFFPYGGHLAHFEGKRIPVSYRTDDASRIFREMRSEFNLKKKMSTDRIAELVCSFFRCICTEPADKREGRMLKKQLVGINRAIEYIEKNHSKKLEINDMCEIAEMSRSTFTSRLRQITGMSFADLLLSVRLDTATRLIMRSNLLMDDIAMQSGLTDRTNLSRVFKKCFGLSPTQYKKKKAVLYSPPSTEKIPLEKQYAWLNE